MLAPTDLRPFMDVLIEITHKHCLPLTAENTIAHRQTIHVSHMILTLIIFVFISPSGQGWSYGYDAIGSHEKVRAVCSGSGQYLLQPVLDNQVEFRQMAADPTRKELELEPCVELVKDAFTSTCERDIYTGDMVEICRITEKGVEIEKFELRAD